MFIELSFAWGQAKSKLGGSWYVHFASLFYIIIYCYSLIYFILRDDIYVFSSVFAWLMTFGAWTAAVRILMENVLFGGKIREDQKIRENIWNILFFLENEDCQKEWRWATGGPHHPLARAALGRASRWCGRPGPPLALPSGVYHPPETLRLRERPTDTSILHHYSIS